MGSPRQMFKKKILATSVAALASVSYSAVAQDGAPVEEVLVTGIRASLENAMDIKRESTGVVDAISAEDIGKMPDSNLAESLQRISGVSIDRTNGEGAKVTVRGIDPNLNMITLNGRNMPSVTATGDAGDNSSRGFDFSNIASESVSGVEVYKTGKSKLGGGGLGATINLKTLKPLEAGEKLAFGAKAVTDTTHDRGGNDGQEITPELSGLYSWVNDDDNFGVSLSAAYQERDSVRSYSNVVNWALQSSNASSTLPATANVTNMPADGALWALPTDLRYTQENTHRERSNAQLTLQYRPVESVTATLDYTYSENAIESNWAQQSTWFNTGNLSNVTFDTGAAVATPVIYHETYPDGVDTFKDFAIAQYALDTTTVNNSFGLNVEWEVSDSFTLAADYHNSGATNQTNKIKVGAGANIATAQYVQWDRELPLMAVKIDDSAGGNNNGVLDGGDIGGGMGEADWDKQDVSIEQIRLMGALELDDFIFFDESNFSFGIDSREDESLGLVSVGADSRIVMGNWAGADSGALPGAFGANWPDYFVDTDFASVFPDSDLAAGDGWITNGMMTTNIYDLVDSLEAANVSAQTGNAPHPDTNTSNFNNFPGGRFKNNGVIGTYRLIEESVQAAYFGFDGNFEIAGMASGLALGLRYESTDVTSTARMNIPGRLAWQSDDDWATESSAKKENFKVTNSYDNVLPNIDFSISPIEDLMLRASYSTTMARTAYDDLRADVSLESEINRTAKAGNPELIALESNNFDLSAEWYYTDDSYASIGYFQKSVSNFVGKEVVTEELFELRDPRKGPRYDAALAQVIADGGSELDLGLIHSQILIDQGEDPTDPATTVYANEDDAFQQWGVTKPVNGRDSKIDGLEMAVQHWFGDSGFGVQANYTMVDSDLEFDDTSADAQFALIGLSDTANLVGFYENYGFQARIAYNWRDEFLSSTTQGGENAPGYTEAYSQIDFSLGYDITESVSVTLDGLNITGENYRVHGRSVHQMFEYEDLGARYALGVRASF
jgi:TonB-dependent receptor